MLGALVRWRGGAGPLPFRGGRSGWPARRRRERDVPVELQRLVGELRQCEDRCELSLTSLAAKTGFSVSSWQRYLGGRSLPPWEAVDALGRLGQAEHGRLRVVWETAVDVWADTDRPRTTLDQGPSPKAGAGQEAAGPAGLEGTGPAGRGRSSGRTPWPRSPGRTYRPSCCPRYRGQRWSAAFRRPSGRTPCTARRRSGGPRRWTSTWIR
ncbi:helix-turn-helix domain-containing protein [Streptomyces mirabilis]|uniref:helix-turn-helix domain-containing protein n=1 Tax=Streptomyces mirabilis TaxID=68239 RepID=UPI003319E54D